MDLTLLSYYGKNAIIFQVKFCNFENFIVNLRLSFKSWLSAVNITMQLFDSNVKVSSSRFTII